MNVCRFGVSSHRHSCNHFISYWASLHARHSPGPLVTFGPLRGSFPKSWTSLGIPQPWEWLSFEITKSGYLSFSPPAGGVPGTGEEGAHGPGASKAEARGRPETDPGGHHGSGECQATAGWAAEKVAYFPHSCLFFLPSPAPCSVDDSLSWPKTPILRGNSPI